MILVYKEEVMVVSNRSRGATQVREPSRIWQPTSETIASEVETSSIGMLNTFFLNFNVLLWFIQYYISLC